MAMSGSVSWGSDTVMKQPLTARAVEVGVDLARGLAGEAGDGLELIARRGDDGLGRAEVLEQRALASGADAGQVVEQRLRHRGVRAGPVVGDGEPVRLVAQALLQLQSRRFMNEHDRVEPTRHEDLLD